MVTKHNFKITFFFQFIQIDPVLLMNIKMLLWHQDNFRQWYQNLKTRIAVYYEVLKNVIPTEDKML